MCGIAGRIRHDAGSIGSDIVELAACMSHRGADSTGFAIYGPPRPSGLVVRVFVADRGRLDVGLEGLRAATREHGADFVADPTWDSTGQRHVAVRLEVSTPRSLPAWVEACDELPGVELQSVGRSLEIVKDVGDARTVDAKHGISAMQGTHALSNMRLATESLVSPIASHPFWARPFPDVCIVHNGQLTNYYTWRRRLTRAGYRFTTENDSELIAVWNSVQMAAGATLAESLRTSLAALDGVFTYLLATPEGIGMAKDRWAIKPLAAVEERAGVALATEEQALRSLYVDEVDVVTYDGPSICRVWPVAGAQAVAA
jgi:glutamate synthase domain-containing protein 1